MYSNFELFQSSDAGNLGIGLRLSRKESYKAQRQHYRREKKRVTTELLSSLEDPAVIILADWLKVWIGYFSILYFTINLFFQKHLSKTFL